MTAQNLKELKDSIESSFVLLSDKSTKDRPVKRRAMETIKKEVTSCACIPTIDILDQLHTSLFICSESEIESVREQSTLVLTSLVKGCEKGHIKDELMEHLLTHIVKRMQEEQTEEIRVIWMELLIVLVSKIDKVSVAEGEFVMKLMQIAGEDAFPDVQKQCAQLLILYSQTQPQSVDYACDRMVRLLFPLLSHKHTAVRVLGIKAMKAVLEASPKGLHLLFEFDESSGRQPLVPGLIYDTSALVRDHLFIILSELLCNWSPRYRYQYGGRLLPIILSGKFDELPSVQNTCNSSLSKVSKSCVEDLLQAGIIKVIPENEQEAELLGLKHMVHICYDESLVFLLGKVTDFIKVRQDISLSSLELFLELSTPEDLVRSLKKVIHALFIAYIGMEDKEKMTGCLDTLVKSLPSPDIYAEVLLPRLDSKYLKNEKNGYEGNRTVPVVFEFLLHLTSHATLSNISKQKILATIEKPYLKEYISKELLESYRKSISVKLK